MSTHFTYKVTRIPFDKDYQPADSTRLTTNFANLARGDVREQNLCNALAMINNRFNALAHWDNATGDRYQLELDIMSVDLTIANTDVHFPSIEILQTHILDTHNNKRIEGIAGNNFSSYVRDYDFSIALHNHNKDKQGFSVPEDFGELHGALFQDFLRSSTYQKHFSKTPVICLSVSDNKTYHRTSNHHPVLGVEYKPNETSLTEHYFKKMGLKVRYFMPPNSVAPFAFYHIGDLLNDYTSLELISTISTMETFQKIYRPEIYNANAAAGQCYQPKLKNQDHSLTQIVYDRAERQRLGVEQGKYAEEHFINPFKQQLQEWASRQNTKTPALADIID
jgi:hypothetical protein